jgi:transcriptional regulator with XRE-family HTH domain
MLESGVERSRTSDPDEAIHLIERLAEALAVPVDELLPVDEHPNAP